MLGRVATVRGDTNVRGMIRRTGGQRHGKRIQRRREALAAAFQVRLLLRPTAEESLGAKIARERGDLVGFGRRKKAARDLVAFDFRPHVFQVDADVGVDGDGDQRELGRVREIELETVAEFGAEVGLAEGTVDEAHSVGISLEIERQELTQHSARDDETLSIALETKTRAPRALVGPERLV